MPHIQLGRVLLTLDGTFSDMEKLAAASQLWVSVTFPRGVPKFSLKHRETVTGLAFLRAFVAWETFLEEAFTLYLLGKKPPVGPKPKRLVKPTSRKMATLIIVSLDKEYVDWNKWDHLKSRANKCFVNGRPFTTALTGQKLLFEELAIVRNAIAHSSGHAQKRFRSLVRQKLHGSYPTNLTVGGFLAMTVPSSSPPTSFLEHYLESVNALADLIVPN
jgi:hypothetical protein